MSIVGIFSRTRPSIEGIIFDATLEEATEQVTQVTKFPVEPGFVGRDHAVDEALKITMTVGISDNPFKWLQASAGRFSNIAGAAIGVAGGSLINQLGRAAANAGIVASVINAGFSAGQAFTRSQNALEEIRKLQRAHEIIDVVTLKGTYKGCMITSTRQETSKENEQGLELIVEFEQLLIINSREEKNFHNPEDTAATQAQRVKDLGLVIA